MTFRHSGGVYALLPAHCVGGPSQETVQVVTYFKKTLHVEVPLRDDAVNVVKLRKLPSRLIAGGFAPPSAEPNV